MTTHFFRNDIGSNSASSTLSPILGFRLSPKAMLTSVQLYTEFVSYCHFGLGEKYSLLRSVLNEVFPENRK